MKVQGTLESSDEDDDDYDNPFGQQKDKKVIGQNNQMKKPDSSVLVKAATQSRPAVKITVSKSNNTGQEDYQQKVMKKANQYLLNAAETGNTDSVQDALNKQKYGDFTADINTHNKEDWTTLHIAVNEGHYNIAQVVLDNNVDVDAKTTSLRTALHIACLRGRLDFTKLLIQRGANPSTQDIDGNTPLHFASENGHKDILM